ncbi:MAG TPA: glycosyltransferase [Solirubrobacteraceae bacterium]
MSATAPRRRLLVVNHIPVWCGPHNRLARLNAPLAEAGWDQVVALPEEEGSAAERLREEGVRVVQLPLHRLRARADPRLHLELLSTFAPEVKALRSLIRSERSDVVLVQALENPHGILAGHLEGAGVIWQIIGTKTPMALRRALLPMMRNWADVVMTTGVTVGRQHPGVVELGERFVPFVAPVDTDLFRPDPARRASARAELGLGPDDVVVGNVGNLNPQKGHRTFIRAAAQLRRTHPHVRFVILGATYDTHPGYAASLWQEAEDLGLRLGHELIWRDGGRRVPDLMPALDVFWMASEPNSEGVPTVVMEAEATGIPVGSTLCGGVADVVDDEWGFVVGENDADGLASRTVPLVEDAALRARLGTAGRRFAVEHCGVDSCLAAHLRAFDVALARSGALAAAA